MCYGPEFAARAVRHWLGRLGVKTLFIEPGSPWKNGYCESFNSKLRNGLLNAEWFSTLYEAQVLISTRAQLPRYTWAFVRAVQFLTSKCQASRPPWCVDPGL